MEGLGITLEALISSIAKVARGPVSFEDRMTSIRLLGQEVLPAVREIGKELGILDPFERKPGSRAYTTGTQRDQVISLDALRA